MIELLRFAKRSGMYIYTISVLIEHVTCEIPGQPVPIVTLLRCLLLSKPSVTQFCHCDVAGEVEEWRASGGRVEVVWRSSGGLVHGEYAEMRWRREESGDKIIEVGGGHGGHALSPSELPQILKYRNWPSAGEVRAADLVLIGVRVGNWLASCFIIMMQYACRWQDVADLSLQSCIESIWRKIY